ncbi:MAG TPA: WXG100 family type VII secretion target [Anaerolineales bacterium]|nr:WXG100 family type VII secretion target [Anaerolineales bacterium]
MSVSFVIRVDYDLIKKIADVFRQKETDAQQVIKKLEGPLETLREGDWIGVGATAFYNEMDNLVLPAMKRLQSAMTEGDRVSKEIARLQHETESSITAMFVNITGLDMSA